MTNALKDRSLAASPRASFTETLGRIKNWQSLGLLIVLVLFYVALSLASPLFLTVGNQLAILQNAAFFGIVAFAMTLVIVSGEIDISVGSMAALSSSMLGVLVVKQGVPFFVAVILVMVVAVAFGGLTGVLRSYFGVPTFISTLALFLALRGLAQLLTNNFPMPIPSESFFYWGTGKLFGTIPVAAVYFVIAAIIIGVVAQKTVFGRSVYAVGGNAKASTLSGIPVRRVKIVVMMISALAASVAGLLQSAQLSSGNSTIAMGLEFDAIAASIIGGTVLSGGKGTIVGTLIGVVFIAALLNGMVLLGVNPYAQQVVRGAVVLIAVLVNVWRTRRAPIS